jgi:hypothetical protein
MFGCDGKSVEENETLRKSAEDGRSVLKRGPNNKDFIEGGTFPSE